MPKKNENISARAFHKIRVGTAKLAVILSEEDELIISGTGEVSLCDCNVAQLETLIKLLQRLRRIKINLDAAKRMVERGA